MSSEQEYLTAGDVDRLMGALFALAAEVSVLRDRVRCLEHALIERHVLPTEAIEGVASTSVDARLEAERNLYVRSVLGPLAGRSGQEGR